MKVALAERLLAAREAGRRACLLRFLKTGEEALVIEGELVVGPDLPDGVLDAIERAHRRDRSTTIETAAGPVFLQVFNPPLRLIVVGAVHIAQALVPMAALTGYAVTVIDPRRGFATAERFPNVSLLDAWPDEAMESLAPDLRTAVVTLTHDPKLDDPALDVALRSEAFYIGALGSKRTHAARLERLRALGHAPEALARIHGPAGLDIGAESPAEIAVSVLAQMLQVLRREG
ncbi:MAG: XdhC family protein [Geminicoccaceae bacterium]|nr:XdhC family protein [Geminicoccaceae bacterium]